MSKFKVGDRVYAICPECESKMQETVVAKDARDPDVEYEVHLDLINTHSYFSAEDLSLERDET